MGALGDLNTVVNTLRSKGITNPAQQAAVAEFDRHFDDVVSSIDAVWEEIGAVERPGRAEYLKVYDALQKNADQKFAAFDDLYNSFGKDGTETVLDKDEVYRWGRELSDLAPRVPGTVSMDRTNEYLIEKLNSFGIEAWKIPFNFNGVFFHEWSFELTTPERKQFISFPENNVGFGDVEAELVNLGYGLEEDYEGKDVRGKIALINLRTIPDHEGPCASRERYTILHLYDLAYAHGVAGIIGYFEDTPGNTVKLLEPGIRPIGGSNIWGPAEVGPDNQFTIPVLNIGRPDAEYILSLLESSHATGHLVIKGVRKVSTSFIVAGLLPGSTDRTIAIGSHSCTAFEGAVCDTIGVVGELAIAKHFAAQPVEKRKKSLFFFFDSFHVWGNCCQTAITVLDQYKTLKPHLDALIWLDHIGSGNDEDEHQTTVSSNPVI